MNDIMFRLQNHPHTNNDTSKRRRQHPRNTKRSSSPASFTTRATTAATVASYCGYRVLGAGEGGKGR
jgi:hypothetical protein